MKLVWLILVLCGGASCCAEINLVLIGGPGSGKGTLGFLLAAKYGIVHVSAGDILREQVRLGTPLGRRARGLMAKGELFPDTTEALEPLVGIMAETLRAHPEGFVLEGFSRNEFRARAFDRLMDSLGRRISGAVVIDVPRETLISRLASRTVCPSCQRSYNVGKYAPQRPKVCDACDRPLEPRTDDCPEVIARRLEVYESNLEPVLRHYENTGRLLRLDGERIEQALIDLYRRLDACARGLDEI